MVEDLDGDAHPRRRGSGTSQDDRLGPVSAGLSFRRRRQVLDARLVWFFARSKTHLTLEQNMNYVHGLFSLCRSWIMVRAVVEEAATLASLALFLGMIAIWAQVIATL